MAASKKKHKCKCNGDHKHCPAASKGKRGRPARTMLADGFEEAFAGWFKRAGQPDVCVYDRQKCIQILMRQRMTRDEAEEYFEFNVEGAWVGEGTPAFLERGTLLEFEDHACSGA